MAGDPREEDKLQGIAGVNGINCHSKLEYAEKRTTVRFKWGDSSSSRQRTARGRRASSGSPNHPRLGVPPGSADTSHPLSPSWPSSLPAQLGRRAGMPSSLEGPKERLNTIVGETGTQKTYPSPKPWSIGFLCWWLRRVYDMRGFVIVIKLFWGDGRLWGEGKRGSTMVGWTTLWTGGICIVVWMCGVRGGWVLVDEVVVRRFEFIGVVVLVVGRRLKWWSMRVVA